MLVADLMDTRGYPTSDFDHRVEDVSVDHPEVVTHYREAHAIAVNHARGGTSTEELRKAIVHYRAIFDDLLDVHEPVRKTSMKDERKLSTSDIAAANERDTIPGRPVARRIPLDREPPAAAPQADLPPRPVDGPRQDDDEPLTQSFVAEDAAGYRTRWGGIRPASWTSRDAPCKRPTRLSPKS